MCSVFLTAIVPQVAETASNSISEPTLCQAADLDMTCSRWTNSFQNSFYFHAFTDTGRTHMQLRHHSSSSLRSRSEDHLWFCQSENWQGWDLGSPEEGSETPSSGHSLHQKLGPKNKNSRKVRIMGSKQVQTKGCSLHTWKNIFAQELNFRCISIFTSTALYPSLDSNWWQKLSTPVENCNKNLQTHVNGKWVGLLGCGSTRRHIRRKVLMASYFGHQDPSTSAHSFLGHSG